MVYYNEIDPYCAQWLRQLIEAGAIADGEVDERDIRDVKPDEISGFDQCHFFAGIGGWSYGLRLAGWPDDRPVWTGSCPCQPFSAAGKGAGFADERHLWPAWFHLISQRNPRVVFGEQVASPDGLSWLDVVHADLESAGYAVGAADLCAAGVGAPHIRQRLWFVADADGRHTSTERQQRSRKQRLLAESGGPDGLADTPQVRWRRWTTEIRRETGRDVTRSGMRLGDTGSPGSRWNAGTVPGAQEEGEGERLESRRLPDSAWSASETFWSDCDWIPCRDGKTRPVEPGTFPLAHGVPARLGKLRAYGNAIVPQVAATFIDAFLSVERYRRS